MRLNKLATWRLAGVLILLLTLNLVWTPAPALADAPPQMSHVFYGTVTIEESAAPVGTVITASVAGLEYTYTPGVEGEYGYNPAPSFYIPGDGIEEGDLIEFFIGGVKAELFDVNAGVTLDSYPFEIGGATKLNLIAGEGTPATLIADAGGPYSGLAGEDITLSGSAGGGTAPYMYAWDLDNDGEYDDATGANLSYSWESAGSFTIGLEVTDHVSDTATDTTTVIIYEEGEFDPYKYDKNQNGKIDKDEALEAVDDYLSAIITKDNVLEVVKLYFS
jgi:hypothetical protein